MNRRVLFFFICVAAALADSQANAVVCTIAPEGNLPPSCSSGYLSPNDVHQIVNGLPPGTRIDIDAEHHDFFNVVRAPDGSGGEIEQFQSAFTMHLVGTGAADGYMSTKTMQVSDQTHSLADTDPRPDFRCHVTEYLGQQGQLPPGDPDFDLLRYTAGSAFGLPSSGHASLTRTAAGQLWDVYSYYDMTYRIDFVGRPGGPFGGLSGSTTGTIRMQAGEPFNSNGDFYNDGFIDARDYVFWRKYNGSDAGYAQWRANYANGVNDCNCSPVGSGSSIENAFVPEPSTFFLLAIGAISLLGRRRAK